MDERNTKAEVSDRRGSERVVENRPMYLTIEAGKLAGHSRDLSGSSVFFLADGELEMTVHFDDGDGTTHNGKLVRYQRMPSGGSGWAIEFDE